VEERKLFVLPVSLAVNHRFPETAVVPGPVNVPPLKVRLVNAMAACALTVPATSADWNDAAALKVNVPESVTSKTEIEMGAFTTAVPCTMSAP